MSENPRNLHDFDVDVAVIGAGAAGLMTAIHAARAGHASATIQSSVHADTDSARTNTGFNQAAALRVVALDGAPRIGIKILVAGGGRCNVTHHVVREQDYAGSTPAAIRRVLSRFTVADCISFFKDLGVELKQEDTGKLFPTTDDAHTVLNALLQAARDSGVDIRWPMRVQNITPLQNGGFEVAGTWGKLRARTVALCSGGKSLPKSGSDGLGLELARSLGHTVTQHVIPSLVPLVADAHHWVRTLSGLTLEAEVRVVSGTGKHITSFTNSMLFTHFGLSGPAVLDISRHLMMERTRDPDASLQLCFLSHLKQNAKSSCSLDDADAWLLEAKAQTVLSRLREKLPERLAKTLLESAGIASDRTAKQIDRDRRRSLAQLLCGAPVEIVGDRGFTHAEVTAGGVPLVELNLSTMESRKCPGLFLAGEVLDVDGRIGGFNFQWAWASGFVAGVSMATSLIS
ncbi:MAG: NAD(P)/FAD-dependent oxidoreductase [Planctomycetota bacterium]|nr:MAG: NAD(P)/FAD-dependent oxidoreductase [Planctomycetota bacterium]